MALEPCDPCSCISGNTPIDTYRQNVQLILCSILGAIEGSGGAGENVNITGINGVAPAVGNGATNTGTLRVTLSNDSTGLVGLNAGVNTIGKVDINPYSTVGSGQKTVALAGTQEVLAASTPIKSVTIKAHVSNSGLIYVGAASVDNATGFILSKNDSVSLDVDNLADIWLDTNSNGDGVSYIYLV